jgi:hypothetical protein
MSARRIAAVLAGAALALAGCTPPPDSGTVIDKSSTPFYITYFQCGKASCPMTHPATWSLTIAPASGESASVDVEKSIWDSCHVGNSWTYDKARDLGHCEVQR